MIAEHGAPDTDRMLPDAGLRWLLTALQVLGSAQSESALQAAGLERYAGVDLSRDFESQATLQDFARLEQAIEERYGPRGARPALLRVGRAMFRTAIDAEPSARGWRGRLLKMPVRPLKERARLYLRRVIAAQGQALNLQAVLEEDAESFTIVMEHCPCEYRPAHSQPCCHLLLGMYQEAMCWLKGKPTDVEEITCIAIGADACRFRIEIENGVR